MRNQVQSAATPEYPFTLETFESHRGTVFTRLKKKQQKNNVSDRQYKRCDSMWAGDCGARRRCGVCGVLCDGLFPQSESAPFTVFERTLHSSAAQLDHKPLPWPRTNKMIPNTYIYKNQVKNKNWTNQREDTTPQGGGRAGRPVLRQRSEWRVSRGHPGQFLPWLVKIQLTYLWQPSPHSVWR